MQHSFSHFVSIPAPTLTLLARHLISGVARAHMVAIYVLHLLILVASERISIRASSTGEVHEDRRHIHRLVQAIALFVARVGGCDGRRAVHPFEATLAPFGQILWHCGVLFGLLLVLQVHPAIACAEWSKKVSALGAVLGPQQFDSADALEELIPLVRLFCRNLLSVCALLLAEGLQKVGVVEGVYPNAGGNPGGEPLRVLQSLGDGVSLPLPLLGGLLRRSRRRGRGRR
mmetsp:Transcript_12320/g.36211  ORF Transcript_12320/g.36211 Transcript_12320/m.36211 type:complete len:230 (-) Transcript_12320:169-858(-)